MPLCTGVHITGTQVRMREDNQQCVMPLLLLRAFAYLTDLLLIVSTQHVILSLRVALTLLGSLSRAPQSSDASVCAHIGTEQQKKVTWPPWCRDCWVEWELVAISMSSWQKSRTTSEMCLENIFTIWFLVTSTFLTKMSNMKSYLSLLNLLPACHLCQSCERLFLILWQISPWGLIKYMSIYLSI